MNVTKCWRDLIISQREFAKILGLTPQRVSQLVRDQELVCNDEGKIMLVQSLMFWHRQSAGNVDGGKGVSYDDEKALHEKAKREIAELKLGSSKMNCIKPQTSRISSATWLLCFAERFWHCLPKWQPPLPAKRRKTSMRC